MTQIAAAYPLTQPALLCVPAAVRFPAGLHAGLRASIRALLVTLVVLLGACATTGDEDKLSPDYQPQIGQLGKDSVWVPTPNRLIERMLQMADTTERDFVIDLGSGDGRIPIIAARKFGARSLGVELDADLVTYSRRLARQEGVEGRASFVAGDLFKTDLSRATVITLYISPHVMAKLRPTLLALAPGTRVVSHQFTLGDWEPDEGARVEGTNAHLWIVPARVAGDWTLAIEGQTYALKLQQTHQMLSGSATREGRSATLLASRVRGTTVRFTFVDPGGESRTFTGQIGANEMQGTARSADPKRPVQAWRATRS